MSVPLEGYQRGEDANYYYATLSGLWQREPEYLLTGWGHAKLLVEI